MNILSHGQRRIACLVLYRNRYRFIVGMISALSRGASGGSHCLRGSSGGMEDGKNGNGRVGVVAGDALGRCVGVLWEICGKGGERYREE